MTNLDGGSADVEEQDRLSNEMKAVGAALSAFGAAYGKGTKLRHAESERDFGQ